MSETTTPDAPPEPEPAPDDGGDEEDAEDA